MLDRRPLWAQDEAILDVAVSADQMVVLSASKIEWLARQEGGWKSAGSAPVPADKPWPRDLRGRLRLAGGGFQAYLPVMVCRGSQPGVPLECKPGNEWTLNSGSRRLLVADFAAGRNYFDGRIATQGGARKQVPPFYSAAAVEEGDRTAWVLATTDGRAQLFDGAWEAVASFAGWGSDIAGTDAGCAPLLATRAGEWNAPDGLQAFRVENRAASPVGKALEFGGPVTALWPAGGNSVVVVVRSLEDGRSSAYLVTVVCGS
jgi:hypothetical protein